MVDPLSRAMLAVAIGCDVFPKGLKDFGPAKAFRILKNIEGLSGDAHKQALVDSILNFKSKTKIDLQSLLAYSQSLLFELTCDEVPTRNHFYLN